MAVYGRKFNPTNVLRPCQSLAWYWRVFFLTLCHFCFVFQKFAVLTGAFQEDFFKNGQNGFLTSVILHFFCVNPWPATGGFFPALLLLLNCISQVGHVPGGWQGIFRQMDFFLIHYSHFPNFLLLMCHSFNHSLFNLR